MTAPPRAGEPIVVQRRARRARLRHRHRPRPARLARRARSRRCVPGAARRDRHRRDRGRAIISRAAEAALESAGIDCATIVVPPGEGSKSFATFETVCEALIAARIERGDLVVALGGGVIGDLAGFAAAMRAARHRLRAGADDAAGAGRFLGRRQDRHQFAARQEPDRRLPPAGAGASPTPRCSTRCRAREFRAGYAEVVKYGLIGDAAFFAWLEANWRDVFAGGARARARHRRLLPRQGRRSSRATSARPASARCSISATPSATRSKPAAGFSDRLLHGEAVALGMALAFEFSARRGLIAGGGCRARASPILRRSACRPRSATCPAACLAPSALMDLIAQDKKVKRGQLTFILVRGIGKAFVDDDVDPAEVRAFLAKACQIAQ